MGRAGLAQLTAAAGAILGALLGLCLLAGAGIAALEAAIGSLAYLDLPDARPSWRAATLGGRGLALVGYAAAHAALCWRPDDRRAIAARALFTAGGLWVAALAVDSALAAPATPGCGMKWLADLAPFLFAAGVGVVEAAAWRGWWASLRRQAEPSAAADPARDVGS